jgi:hypothetical protein
MKELNKLNIKLKYQDNFYDEIYEKYKKDAYLCKKYMCYGRFRYILNNENILSKITEELIYINNYINRNNEKLETVVKIIQITNWFNRNTTYFNIYDNMVYQYFNQEYYNLLIIENEKEYEKINKKEEKKIKELSKLAQIEALKKLSPSVKIPDFIN